MQNHDEKRIPATVSSITGNLTTPPESWKIAQNPYNFVPLLSNKEICKGENHQPVLHGVIEASLETLTELFIPNTTCMYARGRELGNDRRDHKSFEFFSYNSIVEGEVCKTQYQPAQPIIPGSSIRGAIRSVYEAFTNSCLSTLTDVALTGRIPIPRKPGILRLENGHWQLRPAERVRIQAIECKKVGDEWQNNCDTNGAYTLLPGDCTQYRTGATVTYLDRTGILLSGDVIYDKAKNVAKYVDHLFIEKRNPVFELQDKHIEELCRVLETYQTEDNLSSAHRQYRGYPINKLKNDGFALPVWYFEFIDSQTRNRVFHLSPGCISRYYSFQKLTDIARAQGEYAPCQKTDSCCPACALFGMVSKEAPNNALYGRLRFSDAMPILSEPEKNSDFYINQPVTLSELAAPHPTNMALYTETQNKTDAFWTYDFIIHGYSGSSPNAQESDAVSIKLKGRKFYWHHPFLMSPEEPTNRNITARLVTPGKRFSFRVFFDGITRSELEQLCSVLALSPALAHKLGHGKPLGLGSARISIQKVNVRDITADANLAISYTLRDILAEVTQRPVGLVFQKYLPDNSEQAQQCKRDLFALLRYNEPLVRPLIQYPSPDGYGWYVDNVNANRDIRKPKFKVPLPKAHIQRRS